MSVMLRLAGAGCVVLGVLVDASFWQALALVALGIAALAVDRICGGER